MNTLFSLFLALFLSFNVHSATSIVVAAGGGTSLPYQVCGDYVYDPDNVNIITAHGTTAVNGFETPYLEDGVTRLQVPGGETWRLKCFCAWGDAGSESGASGDADIYVAYSNNVAANSDPGGTKVFYTGQNTTAKYFFNNVATDGRCASANFDVPASQYPYIQGFNAAVYFKMVFEKQ